MLRPSYSITIQQVPSSVWKKRNRLIEIDFVNSFEVEDGWEDHTSKATITLPKNIILQTEDFLFQQSGTYNVILGGSGENADSQGNKVDLPPLIMRGDIVTIQNGYHFKNESLEDNEVATTIFSGFVSKVHAEVPIKIECEDDFYLLKRTPVNKSLFSGNLIDLCQYMVDQANLLFGKNPEYETTIFIGNDSDGVPNYDTLNPYPILTVSEVVNSETLDFSLGHLEIGDLTCSQLLSKIKTQFKLSSFFSGHELRFGFPIYDESKAKNEAIFEFGENIIDSNLEYTNKDDVQLSTVVTCQTIRATGKKTRGGLAATKKEKISVLVYWDIPSDSFKHIVKTNGEPFPANEGGERYACIYPIDPAGPEPSTERLISLGEEQLKKYFYTGYKGSFKTFGYPFVNWGDNVYIMSKEFADKNGKYKVKKVVYSGDMRGLKQEIHLDFKINASIPTDFKEVYMI